MTEKPGILMAENLKQLFGFLKLMGLIIEEDVIHLKEAKDNSLETLGVKQGSLFIEVTVCDLVEARKCLVSWAIEKNGRSSISGLNNTIAFMDTDVFPIAICLVAKMP